MDEVTSKTSEVRPELGWARGEFTVPEDFDAPLPVEVEESFYGVNPKGSVLRYDCPLEPVADEDWDTYSKFS